MEHTTHTVWSMAMNELLDQIEARAAKYHVRSALPQVEELQDDRDYLLTLARKQAAALERVEKVRRELFELSNDGDWAEQTRAAYRDASRAILTALEVTP